MAGVVSKISLRFETKETRDIGGEGGDANYTHLVSEIVAMANGVASGNVDFVYADADVTVTTAGLAYDLVGSALQSILDQTTDIDFDEIIGLFVKNTGATIDLLVGGGTNPIPGFVETEATHRTLIKPGGWHFYYFGPDGVALTGGSADALNLDVASSTTTATFIVVGK